MRVLPLAEAAASEPHEHCQQGERADHDECVEDDRRLGNEDLAGPADRVVCSVSWIVA